MERIVTVILEKRKNSFYGRYCYADGEDFLPLRMDGDEKIPWTESAVEQVFKHLQIDGESQPFRILLTSDSAMENQWTDWKTAEEAPWSLNLFQKAAIDRRGVSQWFMNQTELNGKFWRDIFPVSPSGQTRYIYTLPSYPVSQFSDSGTVPDRGVADTLRDCLLRGDEKDKSPKTVSPDGGDIISALRLYLQKSASSFSDSP